MAPAINVLRTCGFIVLLMIHIQCAQGIVSEPWIVSVEVAEKTCVANKCKYLLNVDGGEFLGHYPWRFTPVEATRGGSCGQAIPDYELQELETSQWKTKIQLVVPNENGKLYFCLEQSTGKNSPMGKQWVHQGVDIFLDPKNDVVNRKTSEQIQETSTSKDGVAPNNVWVDLSHDIDVNHLTTVTLTPKEQRDIEMLIRNKYLPLNQIPLEKNKDNHVKGGTKEVGHRKDLNSNFYFRNKRESTHEIQKDDMKKVGDQIDLKTIYEIQEGGTKEVGDHKDLNSKFNSNKGVSTETNVENNERSTFEKPKNGMSAKLTMEKVINASKNSELKELISRSDIINARKRIENYVKIKLNEEIHKDSLIKIRKQRQTNQEVVVEPQMVKIEGLRVEDSSKEPKIVEEQIPSVLADTKVTLRLFGEGLTSNTIIAFTHDAQEYGMPCKFLVKGEYPVKPESVTARSATFDIVAPPPLTSSKLYICAKNISPNITDPFQDLGKYVHQGTESYKIFASHTKLLPLWVTLILVLVCLMFSALFSGLNLGLMSLDRTELKIISNTGTDREKKYAKAIMPVRDHGNYLLCSILLGNVAVNSTFTILLDDLTSGLFAVIFSTLAIVLLGEITPQAICSRHGLMVGAKSIVVTKAVMGLTAPLAFPVSKLLDYFLGEEIGSVYNRERLKELVKVMYDQVTTDVNDLDRDEVNIISGALELRKKTVSSVMTKLEDVFMLPITSVLDFETMSEIVKSGFSRIPVYEVHRGNIVTVLFIKDLAFVDPDDNTPLRTLCQYYQNPCNFVFEDVTLDIMFKQFKDGHKGHMAFVHRINNEGEGDPFYETIGLVTLEDVIEEMIQAEIVDETDVFMDNRTKRKRNRPINKMQDFTAFAERHDNQRVHISPQLTLATFQFLSTSVDAFRPDTVSETVLRRLLRQDVIHHIKLKGKDKKDASTFVFCQGKPVDYFVLILEGRVEVTVGRENLVFEAGPFTYFGVQALTQTVVVESPTVSTTGSMQNINMDSMLKHTFVPDYSVRAITDTYYLTVKRSLYLAAKRATLMEKGALSKGNQEQFDNEVDKLLESVDDMSSSGDHKTPSRQISPNPPVSASPHTRSSFISRSSQERPDAYKPTDGCTEEQEKLIKTC